MHIFKKTSKHLNKGSLDVVLEFLSDEKMEVDNGNDFEDVEDDSEADKDGDMNDS
jgi:hypothetical protein